MLRILSFDINIVCFFIFLVIALFLCIFMLSASFLLGGYSISSYSKNIPFESGIDAIGTARLRFPIKFYLVGIFFVIFDSEALYLYIWSTVVRESGWFGLIEIVIFIFVLFLGLIYLMVMDIFNYKENFFYIEK